jgi:hypothetical protein
MLVVESVDRPPDLLVVEPLWPVEGASMARSREHAIGRVTSDLLRLGDEVTWRAWHFGIPWRLTSRIRHLNRTATAP